MISARIKKYKSNIRLKEKKHDQTVLSAKTELKKIEVWISRALIDSNISHDEFVSVNDVLREYGGMKEAIENLKTSTVHQLVWFIYKIILYVAWNLEKRQKVKTQCFQKNPPERNGFIEMCHVG